MRRQLKDFLVTKLWESLSPERQRALARPLLPVQLPDLHGISGSWVHEASDALKLYNINILPEDQILYENAKADIACFIGEQNRKSYPLYYSISESTQKFLFFWILKNKPSIIVETGVANGASTALILWALNHNNKGALHSVDVSPDVGEFVGASQSRWTLHVTDGKNSSLKQLFSSFNHVDMFVHDGDHSYDHQIFEYFFFADLLSEAGIILSDDVNWSYAFHDFCVARRIRPCILADLETPKLFGIARTP